jgi:hypothetical protein
MHMAELGNAGLPDYDSIPRNDVPPRDLSARVEVLRGLLRQVDGHRVTAEERQAAGALATHLLLLLGDQLDDSSGVFK